jgi:hypothetical protein
MPGLLIKLLFDILAGQMHPIASLSLQLPIYKLSQTNDAAVFFAYGHRG